jgi:predicted O-methyltransferase YrrM
MSREHSPNDPHAALRLLRQSFVPARFDIVEVKNAGEAGAKGEDRFSRLIEAMRNLPPVPESTARRCALIADGYLGNAEEFPKRHADVAWHFARSSCNMLKGRVMTAVVRFMRPHRCLEVGTAYGFSAAVIASAMERVSPQGRLLTIELGDIQYRLSSALLASEFGDRIVCRKGNTRDILAAAVAEMAPIGFVFHDGGHSEENYVSDFETMVEALAPGGVVLFDDIRWRDRDRPEHDPRCYEGWRRVVEHPRVERAIEVGPTMGMVTVS